MASKKLTESHILRLSALDLRIQLQGRNLPTTGSLLHQRVRLLDSVCPPEEAEATAFSASAPLVSTAKSATVSKSETATAPAQEAPSLTNASVEPQAVEEMSAVASKSPPESSTVDVSVPPPSALSLAEEGTSVAASNSKQEQSPAEQSAKPESVPANTSTSQQDAIFGDTRSSDAARSSAEGSAPPGHASVLAAEGVSVGSKGKYQKALTLRDRLACVQEALSTYAVKRDSDGNWKYDGCLPPHPVRLHCVGQFKHFFRLG